MSPGPPAAAGLTLSGQGGRRLARRGTVTMTTVTVNASGMPVPPAGPGGRRGGGHY
jgi:hypothetical protein